MVRKGLLYMPSEPRYRPILRQLNSFEATEELASVLCGLKNLKTISLEIIETPFVSQFKQTSQ